MIQTGLDKLLDQPEALRHRRYGLLSHVAAVSVDMEPIHLALLRRGASQPAFLLGPEHGFYGIEQDMVASPHQTDPLTGLQIVSLYGESPDTLRPDPGVFSPLDLLVIDLQDVGARYYTYAATAVWAARAALEAGCEVWVLDRPNPLGGEVIEGNLRSKGFESFVGAFELPARHGLTLAELVRLEAKRGGWGGRIRVWTLEGWQRSMLWSDTGRPWVAPSPNLPTFESVVLYPGLCLVEGTELSEGRGTTRPFQLVGAPGLSPDSLAAALDDSKLPGVVFTACYFRPQFQKHAGRVCGGVEIHVSDPGRLSSYRCGVDLLCAVRRVAPEVFRWRREAYEFVSDRPAIDLLAGCEELRLDLDRSGSCSEWIESWGDDEIAFRRERRDSLLYAERKLS